MSFDPQLTPKKQIKNLIMILAASLFCALLLTLFMLYNYGPEGHYLLKNALLSPEIISHISENEKNSKVKDKALVNIDNIKFSYQDLETKKKDSLNVDKQTYNKFYNMIGEDKSLNDIPSNIQAEFSQMPVASLILNISSKDKMISSENQIFQEVQFLYKGDYYRLRLRESSASHWIYFYHPHIYDDAFTLFSERAAK